MLGNSFQFFFVYIVPSILFKMFIIFISFGELARVIFINNSCFLEINNLLDLMLSVVGLLVPDFLPLTFKILEFPNGGKLRLKVSHENLNELIFNQNHKHKSEKAHE